MKLEFNDRRAQRTAEKAAKEQKKVALPLGERSDRRRYPRLEAPVECIYLSDRQTIVKTFANITIRGIFIETATPDPAGTRALMRVGISAREGMIMCAGEVVWRRDERGASVLKGRGMGV